MCLERYLRWVDDVCGMAMARRYKHASLGFALGCATADLMEGGGVIKDLWEIEAYIRAHGFCVETLKQAAN